MRCKSVIQTSRDLTNPGRNGNLSTSDQVESLHQQLLAWERCLDETVQYSAGCPPSVCVLQ